MNKNDYIIHNVIKDVPDIVQKRMIIKNDIKVEIKMLVNYNIKLYNDIILQTI